MDATRSDYERGDRLPGRDRRRTGSPSRWRTARSSSRAAASTGAATAPAAMLGCITAMAGIGHRALRRQRLGDQRRRRLAARPARAQRLGQHLAHRSGERREHAACRRPRLARRPRGRRDGTGLLRGLETPARQDRSAPARTSRRSLHADLPAYPGRIAPAADGYWLALFAPRSQLVEFVLREPAYRKRMMAEVPQPFWVAPKLRSGRSFYESLQGGGVKHLGLLKPWAPTMSAGLCVKLDRGVPAALQPAEPRRRPRRMA